MLKNLLGWVLDSAAKGMGVVHPATVATVPAFLVVREPATIFALFVFPELFTKAPIFRDEPFAPELVAEPASARLADALFRRVPCPFLGCASMLLSTMDTCLVLGMYVSI